MKQKILILIVLFTFLGILDAGYLTYEHYSNSLPPCTTGIFVDCGKVLRSQYAVIFGIPVALIGLIHYSIFFLNSLLAIITKRKIFLYFIVIQSLIGAIASWYFMYIQFFVIGSICLYCTFSAVISFIIFGIAVFFLRSEKKQLILLTFALFYRQILKRILFLIDAESVHETMLTTGEILGKVNILKRPVTRITRVKDAILKQKIAGVTFENPVGLAAGFDYEAKLPLISPTLGFGFQTIGTITNRPYEGNLKPRLGRLPRSRSLMVNKGFKNKGVHEIIKRLRNKKFEIPIGISLGRTNTKELITQKESVRDIIEAFSKVEKAKVKLSYYELNISCPNLFGDISFYPPKNLRDLLGEVEKLRIKKPIFIKMPIERTDKEALDMLEVISKFTIKGVIFGNLQKNRKDSALVKEEVRKFKVGNFSGKPTFRRSNELIKLSYKHFGKKFITIGCGGIFNSDDAYTKIKLGASLVQLITGMIFQGPQLISQINYELSEKLKSDGFKNISEAVGVDFIFPQ